MSESSEYEYAGFWVRLLASIIDSVCILAVAVPLLYMVYGQAYFADTIAATFSTSTDSAGTFRGPADVLINYVLPAVAIVVFWIYRSATPGKMMLGLKIIRTDGGEKLTAGQSIGRYLAYYLSMIPLFLGFIWVAFDARKQGWHDKLAGTLVVKE